METLLEISRNILSISRGDVSAYEKATSDFAQKVQNIGTEASSVSNRQDSRSLPLADKARTA